MGAARMHVTFELLRGCLHLPAETEIRFVGTADYELAEITLVHPVLSDVESAEGQKPPLVMPTFRKNADGAVEFVEWGQPIERSQQS